MFKNTYVTRFCKSISILTVYSILMLTLLTIYRFVFYVKNIEGTEGIPGSILVKSFVRGVKFDLVITGYLGFLLILIMLLLIAVKNFPKINAYRHKLVTASTLVLTVFSGVIFFLEMADADFFNNSGEHLSTSVGDYLNTLGSGIIGTIWQDYPVIWNGLIILASCFLFYFIIKKMLNWFLAENKYNLRLLPVDIGTAILGAVFFVIFSRGGVDVSVISWGYAWFSDYPFANNLVLNGTFSLLKSFDTERKIKGNGLKKVMPYKDNEWQKPLRELYQSKIDSTIAENFTSGLVPNPLERVTDTRRPVESYNVVLIILESWMNRYETFNGKEVTPYFNQLKKENFFFSKNYATGTRSNRGLVSLLCSFPSQSGRSVMKLAQNNSYMYALPAILKERGYQTSFIYGGDISFDNMRGFFKKHGVVDFIGKDDYPREQLFSKWGVPDRVLFKRYLDYLKQQKEPFFSSVFTLSSHEPFELPEEKFKIFSKEDTKDYKFLNTMAYTDNCIQEFMEAFRRNEPEKFEKTIFILTADHGRKVRTDLVFDPERFNTPLVFVLPEKLKKSFSGKIDLTKTASQVDVLPTIMHLLGGKYKNAAWGRSLLSSDNNRKAFIISGSKLVLTDGNYFYFEKIGLKKQKIFKFANHSLVEVADSSLLDNYKKECRLLFQGSQIMTLEGNYGYKTENSEK